MSILRADSSGWVFTMMTVDIPVLFWQRPMPLLPVQPVGLLEMWLPRSVCHPGTTGLHIPRIVHLWDTLVPAQETPTIIVVAFRPCPVPLPAEPPLLHSTGHFMQISKLTILREI